VLLKGIKFIKAGMRREARLASLKEIKFTKDVMHQEALLPLLKTEEVLVALQQLHIFYCCDCSG